MGVSLRVVEHLRASGHDVTHLRDEGLQRLPDGQIFEKAVAEQRVVLTFDLDFGEIAARCRSSWASVVIFRLADATSPHVIQRLGAALPRTEGVLHRGAIVVIEETRARVRSLPIEPME